jgi:ribosome-associated heat shock protein Hsp15
MRLDLWLDIACLCRTRSEAQHACKNGKVDVNGQAAKPHRDIRLGDEIVVRRALGQYRRVVIRALSESHVAKAAARELYTDLTPPPTPDEIESRKLARLTGPFPRAGSTGAPDKRERRELRRLKERH